MEKMLTCKEAAELWNFTERWVSIMCKEGKIPGAVKQGHRWMLPADSQKPVDNRIKSGVYRKEGGPSSLPLPVGVSDFKRACTEYYFADKTVFIKEFLDQKPSVSLLLRPGRFGKSLMMDMLRVFFEKTDADTSRYFLNKRIWNCGESYRRHQGIYPVISLSFRDFSFDTWDKALKKFSDLMQREYARHCVLYSSDKLSKSDKGTYGIIAEGIGDEIGLTSSLFNLCKMLHEHYGTEAIIMIDDYDIPFRQSRIYGYSDQLVFFLKNLFSTAFKDNPHLAFGILCGTHKYPAEVIFHDITAPRVFSMMDSSFRSAFGFSEDELLQMAAYTGIKVDADVFSEWYGGYRAGVDVLMNPWSVVSCMANSGKIQPYWINTGAVKILHSLFQSNIYGSMEQLRSLLMGQSVRTQIEPDNADPDNPKTLAEIYGLLINEGLLQIAGEEIRPNGVILYDVEFPNTEVTLFCRKELLNYFQEHQTIASAPALQLQDAIYARSTPRFQQALKQLLYQSIRNHTESNEEYYQSLFTGLMMLTEECYDVTDSGVAGENYDIHMVPKIELMPEVKIEIKAGKTVKLLYSLSKNP